VGRALGLVRFGPAVGKDRAEGAVTWLYLSTLILLRLRFSEEN
jgi:hypothetical protein